MTHLTPPVSLPFPSVVRCVPPILLLLSCACASHAAEGSAATTVLETREQWTAAGTAYAPMYLSAAPEGELLQVIITPTFERPCSELYGDQDEVEGLDFWFVKLVLGSRRAGSYSIVDGEEPGPGQATATLQHAAQDSTAARVPAVGGEVVVTEAQWMEGAVIDIALSIEFPRSSAVPVRCDSAESGSGARELSCLCQHEDGSQSECRGTGDSESCCESDPEAGLITLAIDTTAAYCPRMCTTLAGEDNLCGR